MVDEINKRIVDTKAVQYTKQAQNLNKGIESDAELQRFAAQMLANLYDNCADVLDEYNKNRGIADVGTYLEGARKIIDWASFGNIKSTSHIKDSLREKANELKNINTNDTETFKKRFKELSGVEYNEENIRNFMALVNKEGVNTESDEYKDACYKAFGLKGTEKQQKYVKRSSFVDGIGDIVLMLVTMGAVSKTKMMGKLTTKLYKTLEQGATKFLKGNKTEKAAKLGTSMIMGGATLAGYTLSKETLDNLSNPTRDAKSSSTWKQTGIASLESFGFGAFGGLLNETVVAPLVKYLGKPGKQVSQAVGRALNSNAELSGKEIMQTAIKAQNLNMSGLFKMNAVELKDFAQILGAHAAGFGVEVVGFAGYEAGLDAIKDICDPQTGRLPEDMTLANLTKYLGQKIGDQFSNLGTIKGISQLLMMSKGGKAAQSAMMNKMIADSQKLNDVKFKKVNQNGNEVIEMTLPDGSKKLVSSTDQAVQTCQTLMQMEFIVNNLQESEEAKPKSEDAKPEEEIKTEPKNDKPTEGQQEVVDDKPVVVSDKPETEIENHKPIIEESNPKPKTEETSVPEEEKSNGQEIIEDSVPKSELEENQAQDINNESKVETETTEVVKDESVATNETANNSIIEEVKVPEKVETKPIEDIKPTENGDEKISPIETNESVAKNEQAESGTTSEKAEEIKPETKQLSNQKLSIEKANDTDLRAIQEIDMEAFEGRYNIDSDFEAYKADLADQGITTYAIKGEDGNVVGYYQLEPVENGELYIHSIGVRKELRNSRTSYNALKQAQEAITELAKQENLDKVVLDVDAGKPELVKLYKKFGFVVTGENSGTEAGHQYHDYRMEADVKKVLSKDKTDIETVQIEAKSIEEEIKPVKTDNHEPFFKVPPKTQEELVEIYTDQVEHDWNMKKAKITHKEGKEYLNFNGIELEFHPASVEEISDVANAIKLYKEADFATSEIRYIRMGDKIGYVEFPTKRPAHNFIETLDKDYGINIYRDSFEFNGKTISFNKNGKNIKVQILSDNEVKPQNTEPDTFYVTEKEMFDVLDRLVNINDFMFEGHSIYVGLSGNTPPNQEAITAKNRNIQNQIKELHSVLREKLYSDTPEYKIDRQIEAAIEQMAQERANAGWNTEYTDKSFDEYLAKEFPKESWGGTSNEEFVQEYYFKSLLRNYPEMKPYLADIRRNVYITKDNVGTYLSFTERKKGRGDSFPLQRAACIARLVNNGYAGYGSSEQYAKLHEIPTKHLTKLVLIDKIEKVEDVIAKYNEDVKTISTKLDLKRPYNLDDKVIDDIAKSCLDDYGFPNEGKIRMVRTLCSMSPEFYKHYSSYGSNGPYTMVSELVRMCENENECFKVVSEIIPKLRLEGKDFERHQIAEVKKLLHSDNPEFDMEVIDFCRNFTKDCVGSEGYNRLLESVNENNLSLYKELHNLGFDMHNIEQTLRKASSYGETYNMEVIDFCKALKPLCESKNLYLGTIIDKFGDEYDNLCKVENYEGKVKLIKNIEQLSDLISNPLRTEQPLSLDHAIDIVKDKNFDKLKDVLFLKDSNGFWLDVEQDQALDKLKYLMQDDVVYERFFKDYLPLAKQMPISAFRHPMYMEKILKLSQEEYNRVLPHLQYLVEIRPDFTNSDIFDLALLENEKFFKLNADFIQDKNFKSNEILRFGELDNWDYFNLKFNVIPRMNKLFYNNSYSDYGRLNLITEKYPKLTSDELDIICDTVEYFNTNLKKMQHQDMEVTHKLVTELINKNHESVLEIVNLLGQTGMNHALGMKYKGLKQLLEMTSSLSKLDTDTKTLLKEQLSILPHPEQKLEKLSVISALIDHVEKDSLSEVIKNIKSPEMTIEQQELADSIFADINGNYETQIEDFIVKFNVPISKRDQIRKFLRKENLQQKYVTPPSVEKQMEIIDKKIKAVQANDKIPKEKKDAYLEVLNRQKSDISANPAKYTKRRLNENVMKLLSKQVESHINLINNNRSFNKLVNEKIYKILGIEVTDSLLNADIKYDSKYFSKLFEGISNNGFKREFTTLIELIKANPSKSLSEMLDSLPTNLETRRLFEENGLNYDRWIKFNEDFRHEFTVVIDVEKAVQKAKDNLKEEFKSELAQKLDPNEIAKLTQILEDMHLDTARQKDLPKIIKAIETFIENNDYWKQENADIKTFKDHIAIHKNNIHDVEQLKDTTEELFVRLWDKDDVGRNLFFGNHVGCCTSIGKFNSFAAPQHLMNSFVNGIEIVDKAGNSMGNSMCYFAKVDGKLTFVIDSFEANGKLGSAPEVTNALIEYAKQVCAEMGQPDANVMFGPNYNKVNFERCVKTPNHTVEVIGRAPSETYIDCTGGTSNINHAVQNRSMHEIINL